MSALPRPRPDPGRAAPPPWRQTFADVPWIDPLDPAWEDPRLDLADVAAYFQLRRWLWLHPGWWPSDETLGRLLRRSRQMATQYRANLAATGYILMRPDGGYELTIPAPRPGRPSPPGEHQAELFSDEPCRPIDEIRRPIDMTPAVSPPSYSPVESGELKTTTDVVGSASSSFGVIHPENAPIDPAILAGLVAEAVRIFKFEADNASLLILDTIREFEAEARKPAGRRRWDRFDPRWITDALSRAEAGRDRAKVFDWGYLVGILRNIARRGGPAVPAAVPAAKAPSAEAKAREDRHRAETEAQAERDRAREEQLLALWDELAEPEREAIRAAVKAENPGVGRWKNVLEPLYLAELEKRLASSTAREKPAAGPLGKVPPPPVDELPDDPAPSSYREQGFTTSEGTGPQVAQDAPRASNPPAPPSGGASSTVTLPDTARAHRGPRSAPSTVAAAASDSGVAPSPPAAQCMPAIAGRRRGPGDVSRYHRRE